MSRIDQVFAQCRAQERAALVGYLTAFDPDLDRSRERMLAACEAGLDILELGVPFSDPNADGPEIESAMVRALQSGADLSGCLSLAAEVRKRCATPIVLFSYANPLLQYGPAKLAATAREIGIDGVLVVDLPPEHASELREPLRAQGLDWVSLVAPTSSHARMRQAAEVATGFLYAVTLRGVTGTALDEAKPELQRYFEQLREHTALPIAAGFGIRTPAQARAVTRLADGVVVGTALVAAARKGNEQVVELVSSLRASMG